MCKQSYNRPVYSRPIRQHHRCSTTATSNLSRTKSQKLTRFHPSYVICSGPCYYSLKFFQLYKIALGWAIRRFGWSSGAFKASDMMWQVIKALLTGCHVGKCRVKMFSKIYFKFFFPNSAQKFSTYFNLFV
jgi:hypothetical protein